MTTKEIVKEIMRHINEVVALLIMLAKRLDIKD